MGKEEDRRQESGDRRIASGILEEPEGRDQSLRALEPWSPPVAFCDAVGR